MRVKNTLLAVVVGISILSVSACNSGSNEPYYIAWSTISGKITERKSGKVIEFKSAKLLRYEEYSLIEVDEGSQGKVYIYDQYHWDHDDLTFTLR